jgi:hypothetical protein
MSLKGQTSPRTITSGFRQRAWWILRNRKKATIDEILNTLVDGPEKNSISNLRHYLRALERAGIVRRSPQRIPGDCKTSNGYILYLLSVDCGVSAPVHRIRSNEVYAPDTGAIYQMTATGGTSNG